MSYWFHLQMQESHTGYNATILPLRDRLYARAMTLTGNPSDAEDLVQDTLVRAYRFWHQFTPGTNAKAWAFTIMRHTFLNACKANGRRSAVHAAAEHEVDRFTGDVASPEALETAQRVREAVSRLPEAYREAVTLADLEGYSYQETADSLGVATGTVMSRLYRGRRKLADFLAA